MENSIKKSKLFGLGILGGLSIVFGIILANNMNHTYLSPLMFSLGIVFTIIMRLELITRAVPLGRKVGEACIIGAGNFIGALLAGAALWWTGKYPPSISINIWGAIATGIIIGLVSVANTEGTAYTVPVTFMLMFSFVYLKLPHCVVSAFYVGNSVVGGYLANTLPGFLVVLVGNVIGGLIVWATYWLANKFHSA